MKYLDEFRDSDAAAALTSRIKSLAQEFDPARVPLCFMEVCGSHTMAIGRYALRGLIPENVELISGPGCPVCVSDNGYIDAAIQLAKRGIGICTFGDMVRVPGSDTSLLQTRAEGADVRVCYSPLEAADIAQKNQEKEFVFLGVGFETTTGPVLGMVEHALEKGIRNLSVLTSFKLIPPALDLLASSSDIRVDGFIGPAHVSTIIGAKAYEPFVRKYNLPLVIAGFEPLDILYAVEGLLRQVLSGEIRVENQYDRVVRYEGNRKAQALIEKYLEPVDASWRGLGVIPKSGMGFRDAYAVVDAEKRHSIKVGRGVPHPECMCGSVLKGVMKPDKCPLFGRRCTPQHPVGACMVSSEGSCAAYYRYWEVA